MNRSGTRTVLAISLFILLAMTVSSLAATSNNPVQRTRIVSQAADQVVDRYLLFDNSDFEVGDLTNWTATGNAFSFQPTMGDNPTARRRKQPSRHQGQYWIGTYESYQGEAGQKPGRTQGDQPTGTLTSVPFQVLGPRITFLIGGGNRPNLEYAALLIDGKEVRKATGNAMESMKKAVWDVTPFKGQTARIIICDKSNSGWGHVNVDNFRYDTPVRPASSAPAAVASAPAPAVPSPLFENSCFEMGDLTNWTATGNAYGFQPTKGDNPTARRRKQPSRHQGQYWIGTFEKFQGKAGQRPGQVQGDKPTGTLTSVPFQIISDRITFLIGGGEFPAACYVALLVDGREVLKVTGNGSETMKPHAWDVSPYRGKTARVMIVDKSSTGWGHINVDYFRFE